MPSLLRLLLALALLFAPADAFAGRGASNARRRTPGANRSNGGGALQRQRRPRVTRAQRPPTTQFDASRLETAPTAADYQLLGEHVDAHATNSASRLSTRLRREVHVEIGESSDPQATLAAVDALETLLPQVTYPRQTGGPLKISFGLSTALTVDDEGAQTLHLDRRAEPATWLRVLSRNASNERLYRPVLVQRQQRVMRRATRLTEQLDVLRELIADGTLTESPMLGLSQEDLQQLREGERVELNEQWGIEFHSSDNVLAVFKGDLVIRKFRRTGVLAEDVEQEDFWYDDEDVLAFSTVMDADGVERMGRAENPDFRANRIDDEREAFGVDPPFNRLATRLRRNTTVRIGILDTGVDHTHPALAAALEWTADYVDRHGLDANTYDAHDPMGPAGEQSHGTHVAGIAVAGSKLLRARMTRIALGYDTDAFSRRWTRESIFDELAASAQYGRVVNMSFEYAMPDEPMGNHFRETMAAHPETLFVVAAGNERTDLDTCDLDEFGCQGHVLDNVLNVAAVDDDGNLAEFSNFSSTNRVQIAARGVHISSAARGGGFVRLSGTSMAAPAVSNVAAKMLALAPHLRAPALRRILMQTVDHSDALVGRVEAAGYMNPERAYNVAYVLARVEQGVSAAQATRELELPDGEHQRVLQVSREAARLMRD